MCYLVAGTCHELKPQRYIPRVTADRENWNLGERKNDYFKFCFKEFILANRHHGVGPVGVVCVGEVENLRAVGHEHAAQELVHKVHLPDHVHKVQAVAQEVPGQGLMMYKIDEKTCKLKEVAKSFLGEQDRIIESRRILSQFYASEAPVMHLSSKW